MYVPYYGVLFSGKPCAETFVLGLIMLLVGIILKIKN
jgi:hypothetical protein